jgi:hypothetical protein
VLVALHPPPSTSVVQIRVRCPQPQYPGQRPPPWLRGPVSIRDAGGRHQLLGHAKAAEPARRPCGKRRASFLVGVPLNATGRSLLARGSPVPVVITVRLFLFSHANWSVQLRGH